MPCSGIHCSGDNRLGPCLLAPNDDPSHKIISEWVVGWQPQSCGPGTATHSACSLTSFPREPVPSSGEHLTVCMRGCILSLVTVPDTADGRPPRPSSSAEPGRPEEPCPPDCLWAPHLPHTPEEHPNSQDQRETRTPTSATSGVAWIKCQM